MTELESIREWLKDNQHLDSIPAMEEARDTAIAYDARIGELLNIVTLAYEEEFAKVYEKVNTIPDITETGRRAKILSGVAGLKFQMNELKSVHSILRAKIRAWTQNIKNRRESA